MFINRLFSRDIQLFKNISQSGYKTPKCTMIYFYIYILSFCTITTSTRGITDCKYLFSHPKYKAQHVLKAGPIVNIYFLTKNMKSSMYLKPGQSKILVFLPKIGSLTCIYNKVGHMYLSSQPKYKDRYILEVSPVVDIYFKNYNVGTAILVTGQTSFFFSSLISMCHLVGYDRLQISLCSYSSLALCSFLYPFQLYLATIITLSTTFRLNPPKFYPSNFSPAQSFFLSHSSSFSLAPSLSPTSVVLKNLSSGATALSFASRSASHLFFA